MLDALADTLGEAARARWAAPRAARCPRRSGSTGDPAPLLRAMDRVAEAREAAWGNVNPQILLAVLSGELAEEL